MKKTWFNERQTNIIILSFLGLGIFAGIAEMPLRGEEPRRSLLALEMLLSGDFLQPTIHGWLYYNKPPLFNWIISGLFRVFGYPYDWLVRVPSLVGFVVMGWIHYKVTRVYLGEIVARWSALFLMTSVHFLFFATVISGEMDLFYSLIVYLQAIAIFHFLEKGQVLKMMLVSYALMAIGLLTKGTPSLAFQAITLIAWLPLRGHWRLLFSWQHLLGIGMACFILATYLIPYHFSGGNISLLGFNLLEEASRKSLTTSPLWELPLHVILFPLKVLALFLPWSLLIAYWFRKDWNSVIREHPFILFAVLFVCTNLAPYWLSPDSRDRYLYAFGPFITLLLAYGYTRFSKIPGRWVVVFILILSSARIGYNLVVIPIQKKHIYNINLFDRMAKEALSLAGAEPLHALGETDTLAIDISIGSYVFRDTILEPTWLPYQIPFYIARERQKIMVSDTVMQPGIYYLATRSEVDTTICTIYARYATENGDDNWILCKMKE
jgi:4-amino-4-deoxy-L-arabinose transferase-like glycosyltransferase